jgi:aminopeptidase N
MSKNVRRLYAQFKPEHYDLALLPDREAMTFSGTVTITGQKSGRPSERITFHQNGLRITKALIIKHDKKGDEQISVVRINNQNSFDEVRLHAKSLLYPGRYSVTMEFEGAISRPMNGIYPCFFEEKGHKKILIATQFESHHAREAFPCIDEPEAKATFDLTLTTPAGEAVLANTPIHKQIIKKSVVETSFETTPKMSTYLLAFAYGDMQYLEAKTKDGVVVRTYATADNITHTQFALDVAVKCLEFYNEYYGLPYPLEKCDLIALPDFAAGAMENWGAITFREQALFVDPKNTSLPTKQYVAMVVAHELAHQWFGNLVTMRWWTDLWLNEGFASWMEYLAVDQLFPDWGMWTEFTVNEQEAGLKLDALEYTHPIEVPIHHPDEIRTIFDTISYSKGSSILHMLHQYLGATDFRDGLRHYLKKHAYGNTDTTDLWVALETTSKKPVRAFMRAWTSQPGFPVISATLSGGKLALSQERFYLNPATKKDGAHWPVPLLASTSVGADTLNDAERSLSPKSLDADFTINKGKSGFYRVTYDSAHATALAQSIRSGKLDVLDRLGILSDAFETAKAGYGSSVTALRLLEAYVDEDNTFVWDVIMGGIGNIRAVMNDEMVREAMKPFGRTLVQTQLARLGWEQKENESHFDILLRPTVLALASASDNKIIVSEAMERFHAMTQPEDVHPDLRGVIYGTAARNGDKKEFDKMLAMHNASKNSEERVTLSVALTGFKQPELIKRALSQIDSETVRLQDATYWVAYSFMNRFARDTTWEWMTSHWDWLEKNLGSDLSFYRFPVYSARAFSDDAFLTTYKKFFEAHNGPALERPINQGIETIQWQSAWRKRDLAAVKEFFKS